MTGKRRLNKFRHDSFDIFREQAERSQRMDSKSLSVGNPQLLDNLNLLNNDIPTRAAILLFHHKPEKWIPDSFIKIGYFKSDSDIVYQDEVHGSLISQADNDDNSSFLVQITIAFLPKVLKFGLKRCIILLDFERLSDCGRLSGAMGTVEYADKF